MAADIKRYVISCPVCQLTKPSQRKPAGLMVPIKPLNPWEYTGVDFVGPLPHTQNGNEYLIVFVDYFSKWVEVSAVRSATAQVAASKFFAEIFACHGTPTYLISDRGTPFVSKLFEHAIASLGTEHRLTTAYHPQTNATERVNRTLKTVIHAYVGDKHTSWDKYLPQICFALLTAPHESTGHSPAMLLYGRELETPLDLITQPSATGVDDLGILYPESLRASLQVAHDHARATLEVSHTKRKHYYDQKRCTASYAVGDLVRVKTHPKSVADANFTAKLAPVYAGPFVISKKLSSVNYRLSNVDTGGDAGVFHVVNLQPFHSWGTAMTKTSSVDNVEMSLPWNGDTTSQMDGERSVGVDQMLSPDYSNRLSVSQSDGDVPEHLTEYLLDIVPDSIDVGSVSKLHDVTPDLSNTATLPTVSNQGLGHYALRQRRVPRITSDWTRNRWTNPYHTQILDLH